MTTKTKTSLSVVSNEPSLPDLENALTEFASQQAPMVSRSAARLQKAAQERRELENELADLTGREDLVDRTHAALKTAFASERADIEGAISQITGGIGPAQ